MSGFSSFVLSSETISPNIKDNIVNDCIEIFKELKNEYIACYDKYGKDNCKNELRKTTRTMWEDLSHIVSERFGVNVFITDLNIFSKKDKLKINGRDFNITREDFAVTPFLITGYSDTKELDKIDNFMKNIMENINKVYGGDNKIKKTFNKCKNVTNRIFSDENMRSNLIVYNYLNKNNVTVDLKNAKIINFPKNVTCFISLSGLSNNIIKNNNRDRNNLERIITATLFHEIGHIFTNIELSVSSYRRNFNFTDILQDQIKKGEDLDSSFKIAYETSTNKKLKDVNLIKIVDDVCIDVMKSNEHKHVSEYSADIFAVRFGLGPELAETQLSVVNNVLSYSLTNFFKYKFPLKVFLFSLLLNIIGMFFGFPVVFIMANLLIYIGILGLFMFHAMKAFTMDLFLGLAKGNDKFHYDDPFNRLSKIRHQVVRMIRLIDDDEEKAILINQYEKIEELFKLAEDNDGESISFFKYNTILDFFSSKNRETINFGGFDNNLEKMMENPLYVDGEKIRIGEKGMLNFLNKNNLASEAISYQKDDWFVRNLVANIELIYKCFNENRLTDITTIVYDIEDDIYKRFGIKTRLVTNKHDLLIEIFGFDTDGGLMDTSALIDYISRRKVKKEKNEDEDRKYKFSKQYNRIINNVSSLQNWAMSKIVKVDEKNAYISNLPTHDTPYGKFAACINVNFSNIYTCGYNKDRLQYRPEPRELAAAILHEIGHAFAFISYAYKTRDSIIVFEDILQDQVSIGSSPERAFLLAYKEAFDKNMDVDEYKDSDMSKVFIGTLKELSSNAFRNRKAYEGSAEGVVSNELYADQFANRFGLGKELTSYFTKSMRELAEEDKGMRFIYVGYVLIYTIVSIALELWGMAIFGLVILFFSSGFLTTLLDSLSEVFRVTKGASYDNPYKRVERVYRDVIRNIRLKTDDKELQYRLYKDALSIKSNLEELHKLGIIDTTYDRNFLTRVVEFFSDSVKNKREMSMTLDMIESTMENPLYLSYIETSNIEE